MKERYILYLDDCEDLDKINYSLDSILPINRTRVNIVDKSIDERHADIEVEGKYFECIPIKCLLTEDQYAKKAQTDTFLNNGNYEVDFNGYITESRYTLFDERKMLKRASNGLDDAERYISRLLRIIKQGINSVQVISFDIYRGVLIVKIKANKTYDQSVIDKANSIDGVKIKYGKKSTIFNLVFEW